jgi:hypothetical protein
VSRPVRPAPPTGAASRAAPAGSREVPPRRKWLAITLATLVLVPAYWGILGAFVSSASNGSAGPNSGPLLAFGLCVVPFAFVVLAFVSQHPRAPGAVLRAMGLSLAVGIPVSALASDAVTGLVAGMAAGGAAALRPDPGGSTKARILAVAVASALVFVLLRTFTVSALLLAPVLPFTALGIADHLWEIRREQRDGDGPHPLATPRPGPTDSPGG